MTIVKQQQQQEEEEGKRVKYVGYKFFLVNFKIFLYSHFCYLVTTTSSNV